MALLNPGIIAQAATAHSLSSIYASDNLSLQLDAASDINTAIGLGLYTATIDVTDNSAQDIQNLMNLLQQLGYEVSLSDVTLTLTW